MESAESRLVFGALFDASNALVANDAVQPTRGLALLAHHPLTADVTRFYSAQSITPRDADFKALCKSQSLYSDAFRTLSFYFLRFSTQ